MSPRQPHSRAPASYLTSGQWPEGEISGPRVVLYAQGFAVRLHAAIWNRAIREVARAADISHTTLAAVMAGTRWPDMLTIAKLEESLQTELWPGRELRSRQFGGGSEPAD